MKWFALSAFAGLLLAAVIVYAGFPRGKDPRRSVGEMYDAADAKFGSFQEIANLKGAELHKRINAYNRFCRDAVGNDPDLRQLFDDWMATEPVRPGLKRVNFFGIAARSGLQAAAAKRYSAGQDRIPLVAASGIGVFLFSIVVGILLARRFRMKPARTPESN